jgi:hypothetical protein
MHLLFLIALAAACLSVGSTEWAIRRPNLEGFRGNDGDTIFGENIRYAIIRIPAMLPSYFRAMMELN